MLDRTISSSGLFLAIGLMANLLSGCYIGTDRPIMDGPSPIPTGDFALFKETEGEGCASSGNRPPLTSDTSKVLCHQADISISESNGFYRLTSTAAAGKAFAIRLFLFNRPVSLVELRLLDGETPIATSDYFVAKEPMEVFGGTQFDFVNLNCNDPILRRVMPPLAGKPESCMADSEDDLRLALAYVLEVMDEGDISLSGSFRLLRLLGTDVAVQVCSSVPVQMSQEELLMRQGVDIFDEGFGWAMDSDGYSVDRFNFIALQVYDEEFDTSDRSSVPPGGESVFFLYDRIAETYCSIDGDAFRRFKSDN